MSSLRILLVDDTESVKAMLRKLFEMEAGFELIGEASNGEEGVERAVELQPDVVVMDAMMPETDGPAATLRLKERMPDLSIVGFTSSPEHSSRMMAAGANAAIEKTDIEGLLEALHSLQTS